MILVDLIEFIEDNGYISGNAILKARAKADSMHKSKLAHFDLGGELVSYPSDAVVFSEEPDDYQINAIYSSWSNPRLSEGHVYASLLANSSEYEHWDGRGIFDLISVLQKGAEQRNLDNLSALIAYRPIALQSPRLTQSVLQKYRCGEEASKAHHFYIDREGRALITLPDVKRFFERNAGLVLQHSDDYYWNDYNRVGYYLCSESDLPNLLSMCKNGDLHHNVLKVSGKDCYKIDTFGKYGKDGITVQKVTEKFQKSDSKIEPSHIKSSIPLNEYGYTAKQVKHAMEWICNEYFTGTRTMSYISGMSLSQLSEFVDIAVRDDLIESVNEPKHPMFASLSVEPFQCTVKGNALSMKKGSKRMTENALNKHKATIVERYLDAQKHKDKMVFVPSVLGCFGSAIDKDATDYGDLDVFYVALPSPEANKAIEDFLEDRPCADPALVYRHILCTAYDEGIFPLKPPSVDDYSSLSRYADKVAKNFLKRRSKLISVHELGEVISINADFEVHYIGDKRLDKPITGFDELKAVLSKEFQLKP